MTKDFTSIESSSSTNSADPVHFPPLHNEKDDDDGGESSQITFVQACQLAAESHRPLHLSQDITDVSEMIILRKRQRLSIVGTSPTRIRIAGKLHSLFLLNNQSELELENLQLDHLESDGDDCRNVGAAVNLRYKSKARLDNCFVTSQSGFCCWAVQKASMRLKDCHLEAPLRSAVVCFGQAKFLGDSCTVTRVGVHGVCARGECTIRLVDSSIVDAAVRGLYAYANASVSLEGCTVKGTVRPDTAAIEVLSAATPKVEVRPKVQSGKPNKKKVVVPEKASSLTMTGCKIIDNRGVGVRIRGGVRHNLNPDNTSNHFARNLGGDKIDFRAASDEDEESNGEGDTVGSNPKCPSNEHVQRDASGSSFRKGDWWCPQCVPKNIVHGSKDSCPRCGSNKHHGTLLSSEEVIQLNRGGGSTAAIAATPTWWFDGDDAGWRPYDTESNEKLETAFQALCCIDERSTSDKEGDENTKHTAIVFLSNGRYRVNLKTMEQINTDSHFLRLVQRREK